MDVSTTVWIVCHCGARFPIDQVDEAQAHVDSHLGEPGSEPS